jgi:hypothetical protein
MQKHWADNQVSCTVTFKPNLTDKEEAEYEEIKARMKMGHDLSNVDLDDIHRYKKLVIKKAQAEGDQIPYVLDLLQYDLKGISFLPKTETGAYAQMPYETITEEKYHELMKNIVEVDFSSLSEDSTPEKFCNNDSCTI